MQFNNIFFLLLLLFLLHPRCCCCFGVDRLKFTTKAKKFQMFEWNECETRWLKWNGPENRLRMRRFTYMGICFGKFDWIHCRFYDGLIKIKINNEQKIGRDPSIYVIHCQRWIEPAISQVPRQSKVETRNKKPKEKFMTNLEEVIFIHTINKQQSWYAQNKKRVELN